MSEVVYAIDPEVWRISITECPTGWRCRAKLADLFDPRFAHRKYVIALDDNGLEAQYAEFMLSESASAQAKLLQDLVSGRSAFAETRRIRPRQEMTLPQAIDRDCRGDVERSLLRLAASPDGPVELLLTGDDTAEPRGLHDSKVQRRVQRYFRQQSLGALRVRTVVSQTDDNEDYLTQFNTQRFETQVCSALRQLVSRRYDGVTARDYERSTCEAIERQRRPDGRQVGDVDVFLYADSGDTRLIWVGECELRQEGNEAIPTTSEKLDKLIHRLDAIRAHQGQHCKRSLSLKAYLLTNAYAMSEEASRIAEAYDVQFVSVNMPPDWTRNQRWHLTDDALDKCTV